MAPAKQEEVVAHRDDRRFRELYRFFQPASPAALLYTHHIPPDANDTHAIPDTGQTPLEGTGPMLAGSLPSEHNTSSANTILTTFAHTAALKLNAQRAVISVSDRETEYILAEANCTNNLRDAAQAVFSDSSWTEVSNNGNFGPDLNAKTVALPLPQKNKYIFHIINDLAVDEQYAQLPFVSGTPHYRFYAGTPLVTENRINIGSFFVLDTEPRDGLTDSEKDDLGYLSTLAMDFLRLSRQAAEGRRAARLSRGLSCFVEGSSTFVDGLNSVPSNSSHAGSARSPASPPTAISPIARSRGSRGSPESRGSRGSSVDVRPSRSPGPSSGPSSSEERADTGTSLDLINPLPDWLMAGTKGSTARFADEMHSNQWTFRRAANLIRESLELTGDSGVIFLENSNTPLDLDNGRLEFFDENESPAPILGMSTSDEPFASGPASPATCAAASFDRRFLQSVLRRYPKGKIWSFHRDRSLFVSSDDDENNPTSPVSAVKVPPDVPSRSNKKWRTTETSQLAKYFPTASQVLFVPLWNAATSQWFAGCFCWNCTETQVFNASVELASIMGFGYSIMAELSRLESIIADRQKGDFIGSISHELRSPLHGILAAAEFMGGTHLNEFQKSLLETVNACGRTLLDTMNQVLDFSKIVSLEKSWRQMKKTRRDQKEDVVDNFQGVDSMAALLDTHTCEDICLLTEEVVEGVCLGHSYGRSANNSTTSYASAAQSRAGSSSLSTPDNESIGELRPSVEVIVDIEEGDWVYKAQPGALRRIVMNIFGNAMKYTDSGHVIVRLEKLKEDHAVSIETKPGKELDEFIVLSITDTGKGISEDFLRGRLYTPFAQEDTLAVGTGLGLAIVRSIVKSLGGHISIRSEAGEGTRVKVILPLSRPPPDEISSPSRPNQSTISRDLRYMQERYPDKTVAIVGYNPHVASNTEASTVLARYITEWFGLNLQPWPTQDPADVVLAQDTDVTEEVRMKPSHRPTAMLVFCNNAAVMNTTRSGWSKFANMVEYLYRPCGPHKLARSILQCLQKSTTSPTRQAGIQHSRLVDRTRNYVSDFKEEVQHDEGNGLNKPTAPSLADKRAASDSHIEPVVPGSPVDEQQAFETLNAEGVVGRRSVSIDQTRHDKVQIGPSLPKDQELSLSPSIPINVLVVDDNQINLRLLMTYLSRRNVAKLDSAENGKMAVEAVEKQAEGYNIIFMDISMPVMNGFEATRAIRALENERNEQRPATIIALTGLSSARDETEAMTSGVDLFLTKPVSLKEVSRLLHEWQEKQF